MRTQMTSKLRVSPRWLMTAVAATTLLAAPALAQVDKESEIAHRGTIILRDGGSLNLVIDKDGPDVRFKSIEVRVENGKISVKVDGKEIAADQFGDVLDSLGVVLDRGDAGLDFDLGFEWRGDELRLAFPADFEPKVILGIQMAPPGEALERHLRLEPGTTTMISGLYEGLPAHAAGLEEFDIIVAVDGRKPAGAGDIREALADRESGDVVELTVIHEGRRRKIDVKLEDFDRAKMESSRLLGKHPGGSALLRSLRGLPDLRGLLIDPEDRQVFRLPERWDWERLEKSLQERMPREWDERLNLLNDRIAELQEMLDRLLEGHERFP